MLYQALGLGASQDPEELSLLQCMISHGLLVAAEVSWDITVLLFSHCEHLCASWLCPHIEKSELFLLTECS